MNVKLLAAAVGAAAVLLAYLLAAAMLFGLLPVSNQAARVPSSCTFDGGGTIASGDAARTSAGQEFVCTDGTLIPVSSYGTASKPAPPSQQLLCRLTHLPGKSCPAVVP